MKLALHYWKYKGVGYQTAGNSKNVDADSFSVLDRNLQSQAGWMEHYNYVKIYDYWW